MESTTRLYTGRFDIGFFVLEGTARAMYRKFSSFVRYANTHKKPVWLNLESPNFCLQVRKETNEVAVIKVEKRK